MSTDSLDDLEPTIAATLATGPAARTQGPYLLRSLDDTREALTRYLRANSLVDSEVRELRRMGGGASKEQFAFSLHTPGQDAQRCVLRMDPLEAAVLTSRRREFALLEAMQGVVPAPRPLWCDEEGAALGRPALITAFVDGVTKPSQSTVNISGMGTVFEPALRERLAGPFLDYLVAIHAYDWRRLPNNVFQAPRADPQQAARWQVNWWSSVWRSDRLEPVPLLALAERWLREHLPTTRELVLVHADYRTGNFLFDEAQGEITAILDWELAHIGDYHQDLAWIAIRSWSQVVDGRLLASGLLPVTDLCERYAAATGRVVDLRTFHFYQVLGLYQCALICLGTSLRAAHSAHNHQDALLSWLGAAGYAFMADLADALEQEPTA